MSVVCEASGMLGQQYVESMVWEVSEWCMWSGVVLDPIYRYDSNYGLANSENDKI